MKRYVVLLFVLLMMLPAQAQRKKFSDAPFGVGGGYVGSWIMPDVDAFNARLQLAGMPELSTSGFYGSGGAFFAYVGFIPHLRVGLSTTGGATSEDATAGGINQEAIYNYSYWGLSIEYSLPFIRSMAVSVGATIGLGSAELELYKNAGPVAWNDIWTQFSGNTMSERNSRTIKNNSVMITPTLNLDIPVHRLAALRLGAGYSIGLGDSWEVDNGLELQGAPDDLSQNAFYVQAGIFVGFFAF